MIGAENMCIVDYLINKYVGHQLSHLSIDYELLKHKCNVHKNSLKGCLVVSSFPQIL